MMESKKKSRFLIENISVDPIFHERRFVFDKKLVFVLMPFSEPWSDRVWEKLEEIIQSKSLRAERADNRYGFIITEDIWTGIMEARLIICDTTGWNPNVFYELGIAHTLGKPVILLTQPTHHLPFDTQGLRHLIYTDNPDGMRKLEEELPKWIEHCLTVKDGVEIISKEEKVKVGAKEKEFRKKPSKAVLREAWLVNTKNYDPPLPPIEHQVSRSQLGSVKKRMTEYAWAFSEEEIGEFVTSLKKVWPETWDGLSSEEVIRKTEEIQEICNSWRGTYRKKVK